ncbi:MAG: patatin-like phospholipase family protein [Candidatus Margulisbacteria bacterium]|nr:patatin-like phospholipase family protein [Candidatus Margulisiibacteriota bacterium]
MQNIVDGILANLGLKKRIGLALSGGMVRGTAHIGVLKVLRAKNINIECLSACSAGAIVGCLYAAGLSPEKIEQIAVKEINWFRFFKPAIWKEAPSSLDEIKRFIKSHIGDVQFSDLELPFAVVAQDLRTGKEVVLNKGSVMEAVAASAAFPGIFTPLKLGKHLLIDGGIVNNLPTSLLGDMGANYKIAVDVVPKPPFKHDPGNLVHLFERALDIALHKMSEEGRKLADLLIAPDIPEDIWHHDLDSGKIKKLIKAGEEAGEKVLRSFVQ